MIELEERRVLICAPMGRDGELASQVLRGAELACCICKNWLELTAELKKGAGLILTVEEVLTPEAAVSFSSFLASQGTWSDLPVLVLTKSGGSPVWLQGAYERFGNLTLLERPVRAPTLVSAARSALRARLRQYEIRLSDQRKDEFLAMLAHELRNPLAPISSAAQILKFVAADPDRVKNTVGMIDRQVVHLTNLIDDLLDVARVTRGLIRLQKEPLDLAVLVSHAVEQVSPQINLKQQKLSVDLPDEPVTVLGDVNRLIQVFANLLNNASKYTQEHGHISVQFLLSPNEVVLEFADDGIGISPEMVPQVFDLFAQAKRTSDRSQGGLGLGLALVKNLVVSHGGSVKVLSKGLGEGSVFSVSLPRFSEANFPEDFMPQQKNEYSPALFQPLRLMIVDDNKDAADSLAVFLEAAGHDVFIEYTAFDAIKRARSVCPHICILDIGLPDMDGNELTAQLRAMPETASATYIAVTGYSQETNKKKSLAAGFHHYFVKPVDAANLIKVIAVSGPQRNQSKNVMHS
ncbi:hypothetical protein GCM10011613_19020 [Cellvibrio zantedeschiae]|uniref:histidine kinase n=1 Tax=Cellvibrio zantedeschiae TaxID=1237077 RepID=A0ABQ3B3U0_9GAMM|nr:ATP-binding protein [Cellvibrio zantedeschiae]GGY73913.1 hypothetical protein GCM10011613_19020 [Cellvibrio zantedeschiae]